MEVGKIVRYGNSYYQLIAPCHLMRGDFKRVACVNRDVALDDSFDIKWFEDDPGETYIGVSLNLFEVPQERAL